MCVRRDNKYRYISLKVSTFSIKFVAGAAGGGGGGGGGGAGGAAGGM